MAVTISRLVRFADTLNTIEAKQAQKPEVTTSSSHSPSNG